MTAAESAGVRHVVLLSSAAVVSASAEHSPIALRHLAANSLDARWLGLAA